LGEAGGEDPGVERALKAIERKTDRLPSHLLLFTRALATVSFGQCPIGQIPDGSNIDHSAKWVGE
jgi:hypothetical protein